MPYYYLARTNQELQLEFKELKEFSNSDSSTIATLAIITRAEGWKKYYSYRGIETTLRIQNQEISVFIMAFDEIMGNNYLEFFDRLFERGLPKNVPPEVLEAYDVWNKLKYLEKQINGTEGRLEELLEAYRTTSDPITRARIKEDITITKQTLKELYSKRKKFREKLQELFDNIHR